MSGWDEPAPADDESWKHEQPADDPMQVDDGVNGGGDGLNGDQSYGDDGGGGGFSGSCNRCGQEGHMSRECTEPRKPREGECCKRCGSTEHIRADCPQKDVPMPGQKCYDCGSPDHYPRDCPLRNSSRTKASDEEMSALWQKVREAETDGDFDVIKDSLLKYIWADPEMTWVDLEKKLRDENLKTYIVADGPRVLPPDKELADNQRNGNKKYEVIFVKSARMLKLKLKSKGEGEEAVAANLEHLADAGLLRSRLMEAGKYEVPEWAKTKMTPEQRYRAENKCLRCGSEEHRTKECTEEKGEDEERKGPLKCFKCDGTGHSFRHCPNPNPEFACKRCGGYGHQVKACHLPDTRDMSCRRCGQEGHKASECEQPDTREPMVCRRCQQEGHKASDCPEPDTRVCFNCQQPGHNSKDCTEPRKPRPFKCRKCDQEGHKERDCPNDAPAAATNDDYGGGGMAGANEVGTSGW
ncbi:hypothetical protein HDU88_000774 [Geranomyces variabilis]|nr:hypothetical protein HDU88_000774 [Geranomyces variabilis]